MFIVNQESIYWAKLFNEFRSVYWQRCLFIEVESVYWDFLFKGIAVYYATCVYWNFMHVIISGKWQLTTFSATEQIMSTAISQKIQNA